MVDSAVLSVSYTVVAAPSFSSVTSSANIFDGGIYSVAYGNNRFVAGGNPGSFAYSTNGTTWTNSTRNMGGSYIVYSITNGTSWTTVANSNFFTSTIYGITYGGTSGKEKFIAVGGDYIAYSTDGIVWTRATTGYYGSGLFSRGLNRVAWGGNKYIVVASAGVMLFSLDGINWARIDGGTGAGKTQFDTDSLSTIRGIVYGGGRFLAVGSKSNGFLSVASSEMAISN